ncbi:S41 family peptidase [Flavobacterium yafengii]|uniref:S41 family peptidase n=1 Tax=Flavobacterium yafengii TaxID=3041253 RepID=UPI0024A86405|nr:S41 family peptidase [Flavobacterium yafengii]MDI5898552.1 S41 family peptidase [Flavobacterium yafengii]MDI6047951.1 S41 family peptidase [Flavobacterium yafengii]
MKKKILLLILICFSFNCLIAQQEISDTKKLATIAKIYGFLKYYHPEVGKGKYDWDNEFIKYLPQVLEANDKESLSKIYNNWINRLGKIEKCKNCDSDQLLFDKNFNLSWTQDSEIFNTELTAKLKYIEENRFQGENFYVTTEPVGTIKVTNEPVYQNFSYPSEEYRLLGLFKYWNIIEYFYPYKYLTDQKWDSVLTEMIPKFRSASNKEDYQSLVKELIAKLDDTHAWVSFNAEKVKYLPVKISNIDNKAVVSGFYNDSLAKVNNLKLGDILLKINDVNIQEETEKKSKYISGSNANIKIRQTYQEILLGKDSIITLTIERNNQIEKIQANRYNFDDFKYWDSPKAVKTKSINEKIGYINMASIKGADVSDIFKSFENKKVIIIDLRNYPASIYKLLSKHLNSEKRDFSKIYSPNMDYPGMFRYKENLQTGIKNSKNFKGKVILLVNDESISKSEFTAMAIQTADNVITIGNQTAGADGNVVIFEYIGGYKTAISGNGILYPDKTETQRKGIKIDIEIKPTIEGLKQGRDEILDKAIELGSE